MEMSGYRMFMLICKSFLTDMTFDDEDTRHHTEVLVSNNSINTSFRVQSCQNMVA